MSETTRLARFVPYLLSITSNAVSERIAREYHSRFGLKIPEWRIMAVLGDTGEATQRELTELTVMDKVAVNRAVKALAERGLVDRAPNRSDGRSHMLELTATGRELHDEILPLALGMEERMLDGLDGAEREALVSALAKIREAATG
ncbi:MarR family transcriptional regulator [Alteriqipengyuania flavescens]|uniref:MarR family winged helix-turn-helix transcriptional regulator n=1 Tax=Alteriqipengyuania flavescens TaxID=3053610 RepID=UPI0025B321E8|nr:MarR family transcriptional regulator [Alteriqipengyuania flavescens]WJY19124.1 MarR family transcriptional regulator [Alteriqipengyuania flavescens]WJY25065.1 MarR family transcriptional regulator [Alteriqipengyuania flavescens]